MAYNKKVPTNTGFLDTPPEGYQRHVFGNPNLPLLSPKSWNENGGYNPERFQAGAIESLGQERGFGLDAERNAFDDYQGFDPSQAFNQYADATLHQTGAALGDALDNLTQRSVGAGRLKTGFFDRDAGDTSRRFYSDAQDKINQAAMQTTGMRQQQLAGLLDFGTQARDRYLDLLYGNFDRVTGQENAKTGFGDVASGALKTAASILPFAL